MIAWRHRAARKADQCREAVALLQPYLDGELDEKTAHRVASHIADCYQCGLEAGVYQQLSLSLREGVRPPKETVARLQSFIDGLETHDV
jgi:anti-sigma factor RsiW